MSRIKGNTSEDTMHNAACAVSALSCLVGSRDDWDLGENERYGLFIILATIADELRQAAGTAEPG